MDDHTLAILLCLLSAVTVATANFTVKRGGDVLTARMVLSLTMAATMAPFAIFVPPPPIETWPAVACGIFAHWIYQFAMIRSLHRGDLSLVFPVMRGLAPLITAIFATIFLSEWLNLWQIAGLLIASLAIIVFALPTQRTESARSLDRAALFWAAMTAIGIGAYSTIDAGIVRTMPNPWSYIVWLFILDCIGITAVTLWTRRGDIVERVRPQLKANVLGGVGGAISYAAAVYAFTLTDAAIVTALRETSVVFAAFLGALFLKEGFGPRRIAAAGVLAGGLVMMQVAA